MSPVRPQSFPPRRRHRTAAHRPLLRLPAGAADVAVDVDDGDDSWMSHDELLALARSIQAAAIADDLAELSRSVQRLRRGLRHHIEVERAQQDNLASPLRAVVFGGQDRLLRLVDAISHDADGDREYACVRRGAELVVALSRQATLEAAALLRRVDPGSGDN
jgi:hypothetical protein